ncbi:MAG: zinc-ribbon domain-containing protein, partial [Methyloceanibacter sp.]|nr:zinc-ribbon domain-containing protein [Methyloceanibacter sp.]
MATLIICPACETRYATQAVFPPDGRKVRCAKCAHVWQALPVTMPPEPVAQMAPPPQPAPAAKPPQAPPPPPKPAAAVNVGMRGFAGIAPAAPPANPSFTEAGMDADLAAQLARMNADAMA